MTDPARPADPEEEIRQLLERIGQVARGSGLLPLEHPIDAGGVRLTNPPKKRGAPAEPPGDVPGDVGEQPVSVIVVYRIVRAFRAGPEAAGELWPTRIADLSEKGPKEEWVAERTVSRALGWLLDHGHAAQDARGWHLREHQPRLPFDIWRSEALPPGEGGA